MTAATGTCTTLTMTESASSPDSTEMIAEPLLFDVISPESETSATDASVVDQVRRDRLIDAPRLSTTIAETPWVTSREENARESSVMVIATGTWDTMTATSAWRPSSEAEIVAVPLPVLVTTPSVFTDATSTLEELHKISESVTAVPPLSRRVAVSSCVAPTAENPMESSLSVRLTAC